MDPSNLYNPYIGQNSSPFTFKRKPKKIPKLVPNYSKVVTSSAEGLGNTELSFLYQCCRLQAWSNSQSGPFEVLYDISCFQSMIDAKFLKNEYPNAQVAMVQSPTNSEGEIGAGNWTRRCVTIPVYLRGTNNHLALVKRKYWVVENLPCKMIIGRTVGFAEKLSLVFRSDQPYLYMGCHGGMLVPMDMEQWNTRDRFSTPQLEVLLDLQKSQREKFLEDKLCEIKNKFDRAYQEMTDLNNMFGSYGAGRTFQSGVWGQIDRDKGVVYQFKGSG